MVAAIRRLAALAGCAASLRIGRAGARVPLRREAQPQSLAFQDLTKDRAGYDPIPETDYVKQYQADPALWPVEFFTIAYRRERAGETSLLVRRSSNGTAKYGSGSGVPVTRWVLSSAEPPAGYEISEPRKRFEASNYPEFPAGEESWSYSKVDLRADALNGEDPELEAFAEEVRRELILQLAQNEESDPWQASTRSLVRSILQQPNSRAAIQGSLRMSGIFARIRTGEVDATELARSVRILTMFPQMPDPMPLPTASPEELRAELARRRSALEDRHGRVFTHISTSNVSNTIHGVYLTLDATTLRGLDDAPAFDLFGATEIPREWVSLKKLGVLDAEGRVGSDDPKPTFISGFVVRQLVRDGVLSL